MKSRHIEALILSLHPEQLRYFDQLFINKGAKIVNLFGGVGHLSHAVISVATGDGTKVIGSVLKATSAAVDGGFIGGIVADRVTGLTTGEIPPSVGDINAGLNIIDSLGNQDGSTDLSDVGDIFGDIFEGVGNLFS